MSKPKIDPASGWGIVVSPHHVGDLVCVTAALKDPDGRVVAQVVADVKAAGFRQATLEASSLLKEMMRLDAGGKPASKAELPPKPKPEIQPPAVSGPESEPAPVAPLAGKGEIVGPDRLFNDGSGFRKESGEDELPPLKSDLQALADACEAEGVDYPDTDSLPTSRSEAADWILGLREGRYTSLPPNESREAGDEDE